MAEQFIEVDKAFAQALELHRDRKTAQAESGYRNVLATQPDHEGALRQLGVLCCENKNLIEGERLLRESLIYDPYCANTWTALGALLGTTGRYAEGIAYLDRALAICPDQPIARFNRGCIRLTLGDFNGWHDYEYGRNSRLRLPRFLSPMWDGEPLGAGCVLYVWHEQGTGDALMMTQLLALLRKRLPAVRIVLELRRDLIALFRDFEFADELVMQPGDNHVPVRFDAHVSLMSLPAVLGGSQVKPSLPAATHYLQAEPMKAGGWSRELGSGKFKVGLCWAGSKGHINDHNRSFPPELFKPLVNAVGDTAPQSKTEGATFHVLQNGVEPFDFGAPVNWPMQDANNWTDTAAIIANLDLVITCDTAVAHLAGAMGKTVWILLPFVPDFRWLLERSSSLWYPHARLFRQTKAGDWAGVIEAVKKELEKVAYIKTHDGKNPPGIPSYAIGEPSVVEIKGIDLLPRYWHEKIPPDFEFSRAKIHSLAEEAQEIAFKADSVTVTPGTGCLIQYGTGAYRPLLDLVRDHHSAYCLRHKLGYVAVTHPIDTEGKHPYWAKVQLLRSALAAGNEFIAWMDADVLIVGDEDIRDAVAFGQIGVTEHLLSQTGASFGPFVYDHLNTGTFFLWNTPAVRQFVETWWNTDDADHAWHDQHAFNLATNGTTLVSKISHRWNSTEPFFTDPSPVVRAWHGVGDIRGRLKAMREALTEIKSAIKREIEEAFQHGADSTPRD